MKIAQDRPVPIPVYAEMSSINPVLLMPGALAERGEAIATAFAQSVTLGSGQFCTNPGLILAVEGPEVTAFEKAAAAALGGIAAQTMLTPGIHKAFADGVSNLAGNPAVSELGRGQPGQGCQGQPALFAVSGADFTTDPSLHDEVFGATSLVVRCKDETELREILEGIEGQLTIALHIAPSDGERVKALLPLLERKAGRLLANGFPTGVEVADAMVHGGPYPASTNFGATSVGTLSIRRFLRPVCYQNLPDTLLPRDLR